MDAFCKLQQLNWFDIPYFHFTWCVVTDPTFLKGGETGSGRYHNDYLTSGALEKIIAKYHIPTW